MHAMIHFVFYPTMTGYGMVADGVGLGMGAVFPTASLGSVGLSGLLWAFPCCICVRLLCRYSQLEICLKHEKHGILNVCKHMAAFVHSEVNPVSYTHLTLPTTLEV